MSLVRQVSSMRWTSYVKREVDLHNSSNVAPIPTPLDPPGASILTPCVRAAAAYALSVTSRGSRLSRLSRVSPLKRTSQITRIARMPLGSRRSRSQRATLINWIARVSLTTRRTRVQRSSRHPRTPRRERPLRRPMVCRVGGFGSASGSLDIISQSSTNRPSPLRFRQTHPHHTSCHRLHDLTDRHRPP
jgi:hypothetical protein